MAQTSTRVVAATGTKSYVGQSINEDDMTVEQFLQSQCETIIRDFQMKTGIMVKKLQSQYEGEF
jgi:hypothetical protein